tara:strand:- start:116 stop:1513 length:1398 start_codon:yes stop_codon:yes gene_type:complete
MAKVNGKYTETTEPKDLYEDHDGIDDPKITDFLLDDDPMLWDRGYQLETEDGTWYELFLKERAHDDSPKTSKELTDNQKKLVELLSSLYKGSQFGDLIDYGQITFYVSDKEELLDFELIYTSIKKFFGPSSLEDEYCQNHLQHLIDLQSAIDEINDTDEELVDASILIEQLGKREIEYHSIDKKYKDNRSFNLKLVERNWWHFQYMDEKFRDDTDIALAAVKNHSLALSDVSDRLKADRDVVYAALSASYNGDEMEFAAEKFKSDEDFVLGLLKERKFGVYEHISSELQGKKEIALLAIQLSTNGFIFRLIPEIFKSDRAFIMEALTPSELYPENLQGRLIEFIPDELKADEELVKFALNRSNGAALEFASDNMKADKDLFLGLPILGLAYEYASEEIRSDREIFLRILEKENSVQHLRYAAKTIKKDKELILKAIKLQPWALTFADKSLHKDEDLIAAGGVVEE